MIFKIQKFEDPVIEKLYEISLNELEGFFEFRWEKNTPKIIVVDDRETVDALHGKTTENWLVAWREDTRNIFILSRENYEKYSTHKYSEAEFLRLLKHELSHMFYRLITFTDKPRWLNEGISTCISGQLDSVEKPTELRAFLNYFDKTDSETYKESGFAVKALIDKYGKEKLRKFFTSLKSVRDEDTVAKLFKKTFAIDLSYKNVNELL